MEIFDPRTIATPVYEALNQLQSQTHDDSTRREQRNQALELYTYLSTWGMMRLKAEEKALSNQKGKIAVVKEYFQCLEKLSHIENLSGDSGLEILKDLEVDDYLGLTGLGLKTAQEFSFWAAAVYADLKGE